MSLKGICDVNIILNHVIFRHSNDKKDRHLDWNAVE